MKYSVLVLDTGRPPIMVKYDSRADVAEGVARLTAKNERKYYCAVKSSDHDVTVLIGGGK